MDYFEQSIQMGQSEHRFVTLNLRKVTLELKRRLKIEAASRDIGLYDYCIQKLSVDPANIIIEKLVATPKKEGADKA